MPQPSTVRIKQADKKRVALSVTDMQLQCYNEVWERLINQSETHVIYGILIFALDDKYGLEKQERERDAEIQRKSDEVHACIFP